MSVVLPVHNNARFVAQAIESIARQTYRPFELVVGDDGSTDATPATLRKLAEEHQFLRILRRERPSGVADATNWTVAAAKGEFVAIAHADDVSFAARLAEQAAALAAHPRAVLVGAPAVGIDPAGRQIHPANLWRITHPSAFAPFTHSSVMFRRAAFDQVGGYRALANYWEDLDLFWRLSVAGDLLVLPYPLTAYRYSTDSIRSRDNASDVEHAINAMYAAAERMAIDREHDHGASGEVHVRIRPRVFIARSWTSIWTGRRPRTLGRLLRHGDLGLNRQTLLALAFVLGGEVSPRLLRFLLRAGAAGRNRLVQRSLRAQKPVPWRPADRRSGSRV